MSKMLIIDESNRTYTSIKSMFDGDFEVKGVPAFDPDLFDRRYTPDLVIFVSATEVEVTRETLESVKDRWPKAIVVLLMTTIKDEKSCGGVDFPAHRIVYSPCSKKKLSSVVKHFKRLLYSSNELRSIEASMIMMMEFTCSDIPIMNVCYNRVMPLLMTLARYIDIDIHSAKRCFVYYMLTIARLESDVLGPIMSGEDKRTSTFKKIFEHTMRMVEMLDAEPDTRHMGRCLKYIQKRYDGSGYPKDTVAGDEIPAASRIIRLLLDYHYLVQAGKSIGETMFIMRQRSQWYDLELIDALMDIVGDAGSSFSRSVYPLGLESGMEIAEDVYGVIDGNRRKFLARGEILTDKTVEYLQKHCDEILDITEPIMIKEKVAQKGSV